MKLINRIITILEIVVIVVSLTGIGTIKYCEYKQKAATQARIDRDMEFLNTQFEWTYEIKK